jgi:iron(II)-dependent oxidoreductase
MTGPVTIATAKRVGVRPQEPVCRFCAQLPATGLTWEQAVQLAAAMGGRLPASPEWEWMAGRGSRRYPWGEAEPGPEAAVARANLRGIGPDHPTPVGAFPEGGTPDGLLDVAGNVWEWTSTPVPAGRVIRGGSYRAHTFYARCEYVNEVPAEIASPGIGVRVVRDP